MLSFMHGSEGVLRGFLVRWCVAAAVFSCVFVVVGNCGLRDLRGKWCSCGVDVGVGS